MSNLFLIVEAPFDPTTEVQTGMIFKVHERTPAEAQLLAAAQQYKKQFILAECLTLATPRTTTQLQSMRGGK